MRVLKDPPHSNEQLPILTNVQPGFSLIRGAAGSGKTTTALMRLRQLCQSYLSRRVRLDLDEPVRVLALTFNRTLRGYISPLAHKQVDATDDELSLTVETFGGWARKIARRGKLCDSDGEREIRRLLPQAGVSPENLDYFMDEVKYVMGRFPPDRLNRYVRAARSGRGRVPAVPRALRQRLLSEVIEPYVAWKSKNGFVDWNDVAIRAGEARNRGYHIVVADECQDLSANQIRAVKSHLNSDHATTFIIDAAQRIYPQAFTWRETGINMRPESVFVLKSNYRNSAEVARLASSLVRGLPPDENAVPPDASSCKRNGKRPQVVVGTFSAQFRYMLNGVQPFLNAGETVAILHPKGYGWFRSVRQELWRRGIAYSDITRKLEWPKGPELVALSTIHSAKGLEFDHVLMPGLNDEATPQHGDEDGDGSLDSLRRLVAMGIGRARKTVALGYKPGEESTVIKFMDPASYDLVGV